MVLTGDITMDIGKYSHVFSLVDHFYYDCCANHYRHNYELNILTPTYGGIPMSIINPKANELLIWY